MSNLFWMRMYWADHLVATNHLTAEQFGAYDRLLGRMWVSGDASLPHDLKLLARMSGVHPPNWKRVWGAIAPMFTVEGDRITQQWLRSEWRAAAIKQTKCKASASLGGQTTAFNRESKSRGGGQRYNQNRPKPLRTNGATIANAAHSTVQKIKQSGDALLSPCASRASASRDTQPAPSAVDPPDGFQEERALPSEQNDERPDPRQAPQEERARHADECLAISSEVCDGRQQFH